MNNIQYSRVSDADIPALIDSLVDFLIELMGEQTPMAVAELKAGLHVYFKQAINDGSYLCRVAKDGDTIVGVGGMTVRQHPGNFNNPGGLMGYILNMYTAPTHRRKGICSAILNRLVDTAKEMGITVLELHASKEGELVYVQHGFELHGEPTYRRLL